MFTLNFESHLGEYKKPYACASCASTDHSNIRILKVCRHLQCLSCLESANNNCPTCSNYYSPNDILEDNVMKTAITKMVNIGNLLNKPSLEINKQKIQDIFDIRPVKNVLENIQVHIVKLSKEEINSIKKRTISSKINDEKHNEDMPPPSKALTKAKRKQTKVSLRNQTTLNMSSNEDSENHIKGLNISVKIKTNKETETIKRKRGRPKKSKSPSPAAKEKLNLRESSKIVNVEQTDKTVCAKSNNLTDSKILPVKQIKSVTSNRCLRHETKALNVTVKRKSSSPAEPAKRRRGKPSSAKPTVSPLAKAKLSSTKSFSEVQNAQPQHAICQKSTNTLNPIEEIEIVSDSEFVCAKLGPTPIKIVKEGLSVNPKGETPLHTACKFNHINIVMDLIGKGVNLNCADYANWTPLHEAVQSQSEDIVKALLENGALPNCPGDLYTTPLHIAISNESESIAELLCTYGADLNLPDYSGLTASDSCETFLLNRLKKIEHVNKCARYFICDDKNVFVSSTSESTKNILSNNHFSCFNLDSKKHGWVYIMEQNEQFSSCNVLCAILKGLLVIREKDVENCINSTWDKRISLIPIEIRETVLRSLHNRLECRPPLFSGMNFHVAQHLAPVTIHQAKYRKEDIVKLIRAGGGTILFRAPAERTVDGVKFYPFHTKGNSSYETCSHYIVYEHDNPPLLRYNMPELKHVSSRWLMESIAIYKF